MARVYGDGATTEQDRTAARGDWLVAFLAKDLAALPRSAWPSLEDDARVFVGFPEVWRRPLSPALLRALQREAKTGVARVLRSETWALGPMRVHVRARPPRTNEPELLAEPAEISVREAYSLHRSLVRPTVIRYEPVMGTPFRRLFLLTVAQTLNSLRGRLRQCPVCARLFIAVRRQEYDTTRCSAAARQQRYRDSHGAEQLAEQRHRRYARMVRKQLGRAVRVRRRLRRPLET